MLTRGKIALTFCKRNPNDSTVNTGRKNLPSVLERVEIDGPPTPPKFRFNMWRISRNNGSILQKSYGGGIQVCHGSESRETTDESIQWGACGLYIVVFKQTDQKH